MITQWVTYVFANLRNMLWSGFEPGYDRFRFVLGTSQPSNAAPNGDTGHKIQNTRAIHFVRVIVVFLGLNNNDAEQRKCRLIEDGT